MRALAVAALAVLTACGPLHMDDARDANAQYVAGVKILTKCAGAGGYLGSGVIVSAHRVLTAEHVVECPLGLPATVVLDPGDGDARDARVEVVLPSNDIARLWVDADLSKWFTSVTVGPEPEIGQLVCWTAFVPRPTYRCGTAQAHHDDTGNDDDGFGIDGFVEHGNSGSGVYDEWGRLVGLIDMTLDCQTGVYCWGLAKPLHDYSWLVP